jgi:hypothetical protein
VTKNSGVSNILLYSGSGINFPRPLYILLVEKDTHWTFILLAAEMDTLFTSKLLAVESNTLCMSILLVFVVVKGIHSEHPNCR